jgi:hypothetical protein
MLGPGDGGTMKLPVPPAPKDPKLASPTITFGEGIGEARFGMTVDQVVKVLGQPAQASPYGATSPEQERAYEQAHKEVEEKGLDEFERNKLLNEVGRSFRDEAFRREGMILLYASRGFQLRISDAEGFTSFMCFADHPAMRAFTGKTAEGIGMGAKRQQIEKAYGKPDESADLDARQLMLRYDSLGADFRLFNGRLSWMTVRK